jgi:hypothetical protein
MHLDFVVSQTEFAIVRIDAPAAVPTWATRGPFVSVTRTSTELSIVCAASQVPPEVPASRGWRLLSVEGRLDLALTGVLAALLVPLAAADVPIFAISTFDTDHLLVPERSLAHARAVLTDSGHRLGPA